jgi:hypothetical protein
MLKQVEILAAFVHELPEQLVGLIFAQADVLAYTCERV